VSCSAQQYKGKFVGLHANVMRSYESEKVLLKQAKQYNQDLLQEKIKFEKQKLRKDEEQAVNSKLEEEKDKAIKELEDCNERDSLLSYEISELQREHAELNRQLENMQLENSDLVLPELQRNRSEIAVKEGELQKQVESLKEWSAKKELFTARIEFLKKQKAEADEDKMVHRQTLQKIKGDPDRVKKNADVVDKAKESLAADNKRLTSRIDDCDAELLHQLKKRKEAEDVGKDLGRKLDLHRETIEQRQRDIESVKKNLEFEKSRNHHHLERRVALELEQKAAEDDNKREVEALAQIKSEFEKLKKKLKKRKHVAEATVATLPNLKLQLNDVQHQLESFRNESRNLQAQLTELSQEVDIFIAKFMRQETIESGIRGNLEGLSGQIKVEESDIAQWRVEEHKQNKTVGMLSAQREIKAREASRAVQHERETKEDLKMKELIILDLSKKCNETNNRLQEFSALYDVVKNERNKYVNLIQASSQALAEMKEKIKILQNEVEILRNESLAKDKALSKERLAHQNAQASRDGLRLDTNKCQAQYRQKQEQVEQQIVEIDKLNSIINMMEKAMLALKKQYENAVEGRNYTGVQLIDRNDELCILYEKCNIQEQTLKAGEIEIRKREDGIRMLHLELSEVQRQIEVTRKQMPKMPAFAEQILQLQQELAMEREMTEMLCRDLETPNNQDRWRQLEGEDPDEVQLDAKIQVLEERLNDKKEQLLEKELVLEEVSSLSEKLRKQAADGRAGTLKLAKKVNEFQSKIKDTTRKMMATVSELSMYQATAMKLQQEKHDREVEIEDATWRVENHEAPSEDAEHEWYRLERERVRRQEEAMESRARQGQAGQVPSQVTRTTAEPRPNAYIPDELGIPKPYGGLAPFKPSEQGATMRHIRKPVQKEIEI
jgi:chromosome segregation ATPase